MRGGRFVFILAACLCAAACKRRPALAEYRPLAGMVWERTDTLRFELPSISAGTHGVRAGVRCTEEMPYGELWLVVEHRIDTTALLAPPAPPIVGRDTLHIVLSDTRSRWLAPGLTLHTQEAEATPVTTSEGKALFLIYHLMQRQEVEGISEVGLTVE